MLTKWLYRIFLMLLILGTGQVYAETETEVRVVDFTNGLDELADILKPLKGKYTDDVLDALKKDFPNATDLKKIVDDGLVNSWKAAEKAGINKAIRSNPEYLKFIDKYPLNTSKKKALLDATDDEWDHLTSGKFIDVIDDKPHISKRIRNKFGENTQTSKRYDTDPTTKEFDGITDQYFIEHKELTSSKGVPSSDKKAQMRFHAKACKTTGRDNYLIFEGVRNDNWINKAVQIANEFKVNTKIEVNGVVIHDLKF